MSPGVGVLRKNTKRHETYNKIMSVGSTVVALLSEYNDSCETQNSAC